MPIYEYRCEKGHKFEELHSLQETVDKCKICEGPVKKIISNFSYPRLWNGKGVWVLDRARKSPDWER